MGREEFNHQDSAKYVCELIGTYFLVLTVGLNALASGSLGNYGAPLSVGGILMVMIFAMGSVSGGHFNPAVTLAVYLAGSGRKRHSISANNAAFYVIAQLIGSLLAGMTYFFILGTTHAPQPGPKYSWKVAGVGELLYTAILCYVVLNVAATERQVFPAVFRCAIFRKRLGLGNVLRCAQKHRICALNI
eukprot:GEMP01096156.1.p1 GENE.GEMP01096156.1~~GEMP01096156.1.p1  ORF type:complete len:189 (+),score=19.65 GEMP01096156.1:74-640(+)